MPKITVNVTQEDIDDGIPEDECDCPIALAMKRVLPPDVALSINVSIAGPDEGKAYAEIDGLQVALPAPCRDFIDLFDSQPPRFYDQPRPFSFELEVPECD